MRVELHFEQWNPSSRILVDGKVQSPKAFSIAVGSRIAIDVGSVRIGFQARRASFLKSAQAITLSRDGADATLAVELMENERPQAVHLTDLKQAGCDFTLLIDDSAAAVEDFDRMFASRAYSEKESGERRQIAWETDHGELSLTTATSTEPQDKLDEAYEASLDGMPYPFRRLSVG
jgi:hypothetical protein